MLRTGHGSATTHTGSNYPWNSSGYVIPGSGSQPCRTSSRCPQQNGTLCSSAKQADSVFSNLFTRRIALCSSKCTRSNRNAVKVSTELTNSTSLPPIFNYCKDTRFGFPPTVVCRFLHWAAICTCQMRELEADAVLLAMASTSAPMLSFYSFSPATHSLRQKIAFCILQLDRGGGGGKKSAALTYLCKALTPPDSICSDSEIGPPFFFFFFHIHIYLN